MGIFLGLATALAWGSSDFLARFVTRRIGTLRSLFYMQTWGFLLLTVYLISTHSWGHLFDGSGWRPWAWGFLAGGCNTVAMFSFYRCLEVGKVAVVAPLSASYPVLTLLLSTFSGERLTILRVCGVAVTLLGVILVARGEAGSDEASKSAKRGIAWALFAAIAFGALFWILGLRIIATTGPYASLWLIRMTGSLVSLSALHLKRIQVFKSLGASNWQPTVMGFLDTGAFALSNRGMQMEQVSIITVLSSLYGAVTVILAAVLLRERVSRLQWLGIVATFAGIFLISR
ncbi:MAG TPA: DMT family transporter [Candidatus Dormibacteraeota bacterium]|jgi:drug/metabolite transporter (DMT)-like permease|nr:DMT family transporter [Candidatus Dormibacteraeota bacterium]